MAEPVAPTAFQQGLDALGRLILSLSTTSTPAGNALITGENLAAQIDPALVPEIVAAQIALPLIGEALEILAAGQAAPAGWLGAPRAPRAI